MPTLLPEVKELSARVRNGGRWGEDDPVGTVNLVTDEVVSQAVDKVRRGPCRRQPLLFHARRFPQPFTRGVGSLVNPIVIK